MIENPRTWRSNFVARLKRHRAIVVGVSAIILVCLLFYKSRTDIDTSELLLPKVVFSHRAVAFSDNIDVHTWKIYETSPISDTSISKLYLSSAWERTLTPQDADPRYGRYIIQRVYAHHSSALAKLSYLFPPETRKGHWPNFTQSDLRDHLYPENWSFQGNADDVHVACAMDIPTSCKVWYIWLRYGQYIVETVMMSIDSPLTLTDLTDLVQAIDTDIAGKLKLEHL